MCRFKSFFQFDDWRSSFAIFLLSFCLLASSDAAAEGSWQFLGPHLVSISHLALSPSNPDLLFASVDGNGVFKSTDGAQSWVGIEVPEVFTLWDTPIAIDPVNENIVYLTNSRDILWKSIDGGKQWERINLPLAHTIIPIIHALEISPKEPQSIYLASKQGIFKSQDGGLTWKKIHDASADHVVLHPKDPDVLYVAGPQWGDLKKSTDGGMTFQQIITGFPKRDRLDAQGRPIHNFVSSIAIAPDNPQILYVSTYNDGLFLSADGGENWQNIQPTFASGRNTILRVHPKNSNLLCAAVSEEGIYHSRDGGKNWEQLIQLDGTFTALEISFQNPDIIYVSGKEGIYKSSNGGRSWERKVQGLTRRITALAVSEKNPNQVYVGLMNVGTIYSSSNGGLNWKTIELPFRYGSWPMAIGAEEKLFVAYRHGGSVEIYRVGDKEGHTIIQEGLYPRILVISPVEKNRMYLCFPKTNLANGNVVHGKSLLSVDHGTTWNEIKPLRGMDVLSLAFDWSNPKVIYAGTLENGLFKSEDGGRTWFPKNKGLPLGKMVTKISVHPSQPQIVYAGTHTGLFVSQDSGEQWQRTALEGNPIVSMIVTEQAVYVGGGRDFYKSIDGGKTFQKMNEGIGKPLWTGLLAISYGNENSSNLSYLYAGTNHGLYRWRLPEGLKRPAWLSVEPRDKALVRWGEIKQSILFQNYPNPFNPETWMPYQLGQNSDVTLRIYDITGRLVRILYLGKQPEGRYLINDKAAYWDGTNDEGEPVASGVYIYQLTAGAYNAARKMLLLK